ncbi:MAG: beta-galactosidase [Candidatus Omnitrophica bacterium]|nr:beta-galactosidase [Candidatus Omnitrophota bacterium]
MRLFILSAVILLHSVAIGLCPAAEPRLGTTFSQQQCDYLGIDWKETYEEITGMDFEFLRLGAYWSRIEREEGEYDFSELDWQLDIAAQKKIKVLLTVGMKSPRWPEYYLPDWLKVKIRMRRGADITQHEEVRAAVLKFIRKVVGRYREHEAVYAWQIENEPFNHSGPFGWRIGRDFLQEEIALVRRLDPENRPVVVNVLATSNTFLRLLFRLIYRRDPIRETVGIADIPAFNIYPVIGHKWGGMRFCFKTRMEQLVFYIRSLVQKVHGQQKEAWVTELQAEPWEPGKLVHADEEELMCPLQSYTSVFKEMASVGFDTVFLWGVEYWYYRKVRHDDPSWMDTMKEIIPAHPSQLSP